MKKVTVNYKGYEITLVKNMASMAYGYKHGEKTIETNSTFRYTDSEDFLTKLDRHIEASKTTKAIEINL